MNNGRIKVIELIPTLMPGGAETMVRDYCLVIDKELFDVQVVVIDHRYDTANERILEEAGIKVTYLSELLYSADRCNNPLKKAIRKVSRYYFWNRLIMREQPDIIHLHLHLDRYMKAIPLRKLNCGLVMTIHNVIDNYFSQDPSKGDKYKEFIEVSRLINKYNMTLTTLHKELADELKEYFETDKVETINNGINLSRFQKKLHDTDAIRKTLGYNPSDYIIGNVASMSEQKNHALMLEVFRKISEKYDEARLLLIGQGPLKEKVIRLIEDYGLQDKVKLLSNRGDIPELMSIMNVFFFPSKWEGFGNVMIEAQSIGLRCVVSEAVPAVARVTDKVVVVGLDEPIDDWIEALMDDTVPCESRVSNIDDFDMKNSVKRLEELYTSLVQ